jgi:hypothetical protein
MERASDVHVNRRLGGHENNSACCGKEINIYSWKNEIEIPRSSILY